MVQHMNAMMILKSILVYLIVEDRATSRDKTVREKVELEIAIDNKDRIINYLMSFVPLIQYVNNPIELKEKIKETVQKL